MSEIVTTYKKNFTTSQKSYSFAIPLSNDPTPPQTSTEKPRIDPEVLSDIAREAERKKIRLERYPDIQDERDRR